MSRLARFATASSVFVLSAPAFAVGTPVDVASVVDQIDAQLTPINLIGGAVLLILVGIKVYKWVRRAM